MIFLERTFLATVLALLNFGVAAGDPQSKIVEVAAEGLSPQAAKEQAMRMALEQGGEVFISSRSYSENFQLLRDAIHSKADGILRDVQVLETKALIGGTHLCRLRAAVMTDQLAREWGDLQAMLEANGNPRIIVTVGERIDGVLQEYSTIEAKISSHLVKKGFTVLDAEQVRRIAERHNQRFDITDTKFLQWVARNEGADVFVHGTSTASFSRWHQAGGVNMAIYNCNANIAVFNTDDGSVIAREQTPQFQGGARTDRAPSVEAGKMALDNAGADLLQRIYKGAVEKWAANIAGPRDTTVEIRGVPNLGLVIRMENMLRAIEGVTSVERRFDSEVATLRVKAKMSANVLSNHLVLGDWEKLLRVEEAQRNVIRCLYIGARPE